MRVLIIEDDQEAATYIAKALRESGHSADHASDGETGLSMAREEGYDVLVIDRMLPKLDGLAIVRQLRAGRPRYPRLDSIRPGRCDRSRDRPQIRG